MPPPPIHPLLAGKPLEHFSYVAARLHCGPPLATFIIYSPNFLSGLALCVARICSGHYNETQGGEAEENNLIKASKQAQRGDKCTMGRGEIASGGTLTDGNKEVGAATWHDARATFPSPGIYSAARSPVVLSKCVLLCGLTRRDCTAHFAPAQSRGIKDENRPTKRLS